MYVWWRRWKSVHWKPLSECELDDLLRRKQFHKYMSYTWLVHIIILLGLSIELYVNEFASNLLYDTLLILVMLALYDEKNMLNYIEQFIYLRNLENGL